MPVTLLDVHARNGAVGPLIEENIHVAPTFARVPVKRIVGLSYKQAVRKTRPSGGFTDAGEGIEPGQGSYDYLNFNCQHLEGQLKAYKSIVDTQIMGEGSELNDILTDEASGFLQQQMIDLDKQFFYGRASGVTGAKKGYAGLQDLVADDMTFGAGGSGGSHTSAYLVFEHVTNGVSWLMPQGAGGELSLTPWSFRDDLPTSGNKVTQGWVSSMGGYLGLKAVKPERCIARICNISSAKIVTDQMVALILGRFLAGYKPTAIYCNSLVASWIAASRRATVIQNTAATSAAVSSMASDAAGIPIVETDSLGWDEAEVSGANDRLTAITPTIPA